MDGRLTITEGRHGSSGGNSPPRPLPTDVLTDAARRLGSLAAFTSWALAVVAIMPVVVPQMAAALSPAVRAAILAPASLVCAGIALLSFKASLRAERALDLAMAFHVLVAGALSAVEGSQAWPAELGLPAFSSVATLAMLVPIVVPTTTARALVAGSVATALHPLAALLYVRAGALAAPSTAQLFVRFLPDLLGVSVGVGVARIVHHLGDRLARARELGSYRLLEPLGVGGMGEVWRASHRLLRREAAVKLIRADAGVHGVRIRTRFEREVQAIAALRSPNTVQLYDYGQAADGRLYYVMELLDGVDLETLVQRQGPLPPERVVHVLKQIVESLAEAHAAGLVHRDVKPSNIVLGPYGGYPDHVKVLDFGLVRQQSEAEIRVTGQNEIPGTPAYLPPEATLGHETDARGDLYSLGCVAYYLLTGSLVFEGESAMQVAIAHALSAPLPPSARGTGVPADLEDIVLRLLAKAPDDRYASARELGEALATVNPSEAWTNERAEQWWRAHGAELRRAWTHADPSGTRRRAALDHGSNARLTEAG